jgi:hypothetical protein
LSYKRVDLCTSLSCSKRDNYKGCLFDDDYDVKQANLAFLGKSGQNDASIAETLLEVALHDPGVLARKATQVLNLSAPGRPSFAHSIEQRLPFYEQFADRDIPENRKMICFCSLCTMSLERLKRIGKAESSMRRIMTNLHQS